MKDKLNRLMAEYGPIAIGTYFGIFAVVLVGFAVSIASGVQPEGVATGAGTLGAAWVATKLTQPLRIAATLVLTPMIGAVIKRVRRRSASSASSSDASSSDASGPTA